MFVCLIYNLLISYRRNNEFIRKLGVLRQTQYTLQRQNDNASTAYENFYPKTCHAFKNPPQNNFL